MNVYNRRNVSTIDFQTYLMNMEQRISDDRKASEARLEADRKESEARLSADRKEAEVRQQATEKRLAQERKEAEDKLIQERKESEARLVQERKEAQQTLNTHKNWLIAIFFTVLFGLSGITAAVIIAILTFNGRM